MRFINRTHSARGHRAGSHLAIAIALATGAVVGMAGVAAPLAAKEKKNDSKPDYTKEFVEAYQPVGEQLDSENPDLAAIKAAIPGVVAKVQSEDDKFVAGNLIYRTGQKAQDMTLSRNGVAMMLESGKVPAESVGQYNFLAGQLSYQIKDYAAARKYGIRAIELGYLENSPEVFVAESYLAENQPAEGVAYLGEAISHRIAAGEAVDQSWIKRGLAIAYEANLADQASQFGYWYAKYYPSKDSWGDALAIIRNLRELDSAEMLDVLRFTRRNGAFRSRMEIHDYIDAADPRRLPGEVVSVIEEGYSSGLIAKDDTYVAEAYTLAKSRAAADKADLGSLESDANAANAPIKLVASTGDVFLSYSQPAKAEQFYIKALGMPGAEREVLLTRLGIAQIDQGKYDEAQATFAKVEGSRKAISRLWSAYAEQASTPTAG